MKKGLACLFLLSVTYFQPALAQEKIDPEKKVLIDTLLEQTGQSSIAVGKQFADAFTQQMTRALRKSNPDIDPRAFVFLEEEVAAVINEELVEGSSFVRMLYPIYARHFSAEELQKMIDMNNTEFGKKLIRVMPLITQEGMQAGEAYGRSLGPKIQQRIVARFEKEGIK